MHVPEGVIEVNLVGSLGATPGEKVADRLRGPAEREAAQGVGDSGPGRVLRVRWGVGLGLGREA